MDNQERERLLVDVDAFELKLADAIQQVLNSIVPPIVTREGTDIVIVVDAFYGVSITVNSFGGYSSLGKKNRRPLTVTIPVGMTREWVTITYEYKGKSRTFRPLVP